jgi:hypothetical protein
MNISNGIVWDNILALGQKLALGQYILLSLGQKLTQGQIFSDGTLNTNIF